jgi:divalent metal cation (Fe/Co/Zn/Cd) transporter
MGEAQRDEQVRRGRRLEYFTIFYNALEGLISMAAGRAAGSVSLIGFGLDSVVEMSSGAALLWRLHLDVDRRRRQASERRTLRIIGLCFIALAVYVAHESGRSLILRLQPDRSIPGIAIAAASVIVMPILAREKRKVARSIVSAAMKADSRQTDFCTVLSAILLAGLLLNATLGWWWADPVAGLVMVPIIFREAVSALKGKHCPDCG